MPPSKTSAAEEKKLRNQWLFFGIVDGLCRVMYLALFEEIMFYALLHKNTPPLILLTICAASFAWDLWRAYKANKNGRA